MDQLVPCLCPTCKGNLISRHLRRKHAKLYTGGIEAVTCTSADIEPVDCKTQTELSETLSEFTKSNEIEGTSLHLEDDGIVEAVISFDNPELLLLISDY